MPLPKVSEVHFTDILWLRSMESRNVSAIHRYVVSAGRGISMSIFRVAFPSVGALAEYAGNFCTVESAVVHTPAIMMSEISVLPLKSRVIPEMAG